jgi:hypothetical protein
LRTCSPRPKKRKSRFTSQQVEYCLDVIFKGLKVSDICDWWYSMPYFYTKQSVWVRLWSSVGFQNPSLTVI